MSDSREPSRPSLEDLLRLKRAERPDDVFWQDFERGLRQKQLASIIEPRPWWLGLNLLARKVPATGWIVSAGAAALFAFMAVSSQDHTASGLSPSLTVASNIRANDTASVTDSPSIVAMSPTASAKFSPQPPPSDMELAAKAITRPEVLAPETLLAQAAAADDRGVSPQTASASEWVDARASTLPVVETAPVMLASLNTDSFATDAWAAETGSFLGWAQDRLDSLPAFLDLPSAARELVAASTEANEPADSTLANPRHARLLASALAGEDAEKSLASARDQVVRRLADGEELYASVTRVGVSGDRLSLRF